MDEFELLIGILVGLFKLVRWILKTIFGALGAILGAGRRAFRPRVEERAAPARISRGKVPQPSPPPRARPRGSVLAPPPGDDTWVPPPPPPSFARAAASAPAAEAGSWLTPELVRDALVLDTLLHRRRR
jgi:hypothetical protein